MDKLFEYVCDELEELERKADKNGKLSMQEIQYLDTLAHTKKNLMKVEEMTCDENGSSHGRMMGYSYARGRGRNAKRDSMGRYSSRGNSMDSNMSYDDYSREDPKEELAMALRELKRDAKDSETEQMISRWIKQLD